MPDHPLRPLLEPRSIAVVGASARKGSLGYQAAYQAIIGGFGGPVYPINPKYDSILDTPCYPSFAALPEPAELVVLAVGDRHVEEQLKLAIEHGARAATIFASGYLENDVEPSLTERLRRIAQDAGIPMCGANCLGFAQLEAGVRATWFEHEELKPGTIAMISHSGIVYRAMSAADPRLRFNLIVSPGQELVTTAADYVDYAVDLESTCVIGLMLETIRDPDGFRAALERANAKQIPVVALKVGQTALSTKLAQSHSGALAGNDAAYDALFDCYGVQRVQDIDEFSATLALLSAYPRLGPGKLSAAHDSGGLRGMVVDLADRFSVEFAEINDETTAKLADALDFGLLPVNPVDAWGSPAGSVASFNSCLDALAEDPDTALTIMFTDITSDDADWEEFRNIPLESRKRTGKPMALALNWSRQPHALASADITYEGIPVLDGATNALLAVKHAFAYRDFLALPEKSPPPAPDRDVVEKWRARLESRAPLDEAESASLLSEFGIPMVHHVVTDDLASTQAVARQLGYPVVLKTAEAGIQHKSDVGGVKPGISDEEELVAAYGDLVTRLGPRTLVAPMVKGTMEMALGVVVDEQFGPMVMVAAGGILIEVLNDRTFLLPPIDEAVADRALAGLKIAPLLDGARGADPVDRPSLCKTIACLGVMATALGDVLAEVDVNPLIVGPDGCVAVDALVVPRS
jgi:acetate---CoA ligase (ADP-forming)